MLPAEHPRKGAERHQRPIPLCFLTVDACGCLPSATSSRFPGKNSPRCVSKAAFSQEFPSNRQFSVCLVEYWSPISFQGFLYNMQEHGLKSLLPCADPGTRTHMPATMPTTHSTSSHHCPYAYKLTLKEVSSLKKDLDRTAKTEFFTIHNAF